MMDTLKCCFKCQKKQPLDNFYRNKSKKDGYKDDCKDCFRDYMRSYSHTSQNKAYRKQYAADFYQTEHGIIIAMLNHSKKADNKYGRDITNYMTYGDIQALKAKQDNKCIYSGKELVWKSNSPDDVLASIDRIDSFKAHVKGNIQLVSRKMNNLKGTKSHDEFVEWLQVNEKYLN